MSTDWREVQVGRYTGVLDGVLCGADTLAVLPSLGDRVSRASSADVIADGRNRHVRMSLAAAGAQVDTLIKSFGREAAAKDALDRVRGTKARRTWEVARALQRAGVGTPRPLGYLERRSGGRLRESYYLSEYLDGIRSFTGELNRLLMEDPECWKFMSLLQTVANAVRAMHEAGVQHNDLGNQNILLRCVGDGRWDGVCFIDLNRARVLPALSLRQRARDISRIYLPGDFLRVFKEMYFGGVPPAEFQVMEERCRRSYAWHSRTRMYRHPLRTIRCMLEGGGKRTYPLERDMWVWDERTAQPVNVMRSRERRKEHRAADHARTAGTVAAGAPRVLREYRRLLADCYRFPVRADGRMGVAIDPGPETADRELAELEDLGRVPVLLRFCHHRGDAGLEFSLDLMRRLHGAGRSVSIALVQSRRAVLDPADWKRFVTRVFDGAGAMADFIEVGHAVNRVKWGLWEQAEHRRLLEEAAEVAAGHSGLRLMGPAAIDFEYHALMSALRNAPAGMRFSALSHHLYVDRRGAPENAQGGFSAVHKFALARAIARWSGCCEDRLVVSEVNWPIAGTGVYSPVGAPYVSPGPRLNDPSVSEDDYADFMIRYLMMAISSGMVERVYWWRLVARGYGLIDDGDPAQWRRRPAYGMLRTLLGRLEGSTFCEVLGRKPGFRRAAGEPPWTCFVMDGPSGRFAVAYSQEKCDARPPFAYRRALDAFGREIEPGQAALPLTGRPVYLIA